MILAYIRLARPLNLFIIGLTMYGLGWYYDGICLDSIPGIGSLPFFLLVFSTMVIAGAGNIINDYFDIKADRINKPNKIILSKEINRRKAITLHWILNFIAFSIAIYLSFIFKSFWYVFIHVISINILWLYSSLFKRKFLVGNLFVAGLTALVPILVGLYFSDIQNDPRSLSVFPLENYTFSSYIMYISTFTAIFAFLLNLSREILKDIEDIKGDLKLNADTIPIRLGYRKSKFIVITILLLNLIYSLCLLMFFDKIEIINLIPLYLSLLLVVTSIIITFRSKTRKMIKQASLSVKLAMVFGVLTPIYWQLVNSVL